MTINLVELAQGTFTRPVLRKISALLGQDEAVTHAAVEAATPALIGGLAQQASTPSGATSLAASLDRIDTRPAENLGAALDGPGGQHLIDAGMGHVKNLFGGNLGTVTESIGRASGMGKGVVGNLLGLIAPIVMGLVARQKKAMGLDAAGLARFLGEQRRFVARALPPEVGDAIGIDSDLAHDATRATHETARTYDARTPAAAGARSDPGPESRKSWARKLVPVLLIAAIAFVGWSLLTRDRDESVIGERGTQGTAREAAAPRAGAVTEEARGAVDRATSALAGVRDEASARAALPELEAAAEDVESLATRAQVLPESTRAGLGQIVSSALPTLRSRADRAMEIPGVRAVLSPVVERLTDGLEKLRR